MDIPEDIRQYLITLLEQAKIEPATDEMKEKMLGELYFELDKYTAAKLIEHMPIEHLEAFLDLQEKKNPQELEAFLIEYLPNVQQLYTDSFKEFGILYLENIAKARAVRS
ncbi:MAG TPA: DUF5663 domain-containing protein [Candidatus Saccharimonadales bacterium]|nr:DUF5663 domain-containing protein [Candidatus Saccharimonadales bacterium]